MGQWKFRAAIGSLFARTRRGRCSRCTPRGNSGSPARSTRKGRAVFGLLAFLLWLAPHLQQRTSVIEHQPSGGKNGMAEIRVEPQQRGRGRIWLLILLLVIVAAAVWYFASRRSATGSATASTPAPASAPATTP